MGPQETDELLLNTLARLQDKARREYEAAWMQKELSLLQSENRLLKDRKRVDKLLAALESKNRLDSDTPTEERLAALRTENELLKMRKLLKVALESVAQMVAQLQMDRQNGKPAPRPADTSELHEERRLRRRAKSTITEAELRAVHNAPNTLDAAMEHVGAGRATLLNPA
jgi:hypothetical protein